MNYSGNNVPEKDSSFLFVCFLPPKSSDFLIKQGYFCGGSLCLDHCMTPGP